MFCIDRGRTLLAFVLFAALGYAQTADGQIVFTDDFNADSIGGNPTTSVWNLREEGGTDRVIEVLEDTGDIFGEGTSNRMVHHLDANNGAGGTTVGASNVFAATDVATFSYDFFEPSTGGSDPIVFRPLNSGATLVSGSGNFLFNIGFDDGDVEGNVGVYTLDEAHHVDIIVNNSNSALSYLDGDESVADLAADVWIDGVLVAEDIARSNAGTLRGLGFIVGNSTQNEIFFDNIVVRDEAFVLNPQTDNLAVPEPSTITMWSLFGVLTALGWLRCRNRKNE